MIILFFWKKIMLLLIFQRHWFAKYVSFQISLFWSKIKNSWFIIWSGVLFRFLGHLFILVLHKFLFGCFVMEERFLASSDFWPNLNFFAGPQNRFGSMNPTKKTCFNRVSSRFGDFSNFLTPLGCLSGGWNGKNAQYFLQNDQKSWFRPKPP